MKPAHVLALALLLVLAISHMVHAGPPAEVPKTGQKTCYYIPYTGAVLPTPCPGTGQDGEFQAGVAWPDPRFTDNADGSVTDNLTGLVWLKEAYCNSQMFSWQNALNFANGLADGQCGLTDGSAIGEWHLPTINELESLLDYDRYAPALPENHPFVNVQFTDQVSPFFWSSTTHNDRIDPMSPRQAFAIDFRRGTFYYHLKSGAYYVLAVKNARTTGATAIPRTGQTTCYDTAGTVIACAGTGQDGDLRPGTPWPEPRFADNGDGTVTDRLTGLVWLKNANCSPPLGKKYWSSTPSAVAGISHGDCDLSDNSQDGDWRVPNVRELLSLMDYEKASPALPTGHPFSNVYIQGEVHNYYWTSTSYYEYWANNFCVDFRKGYMYDRIKADSWYIWPVRTARSVNTILPAINLMLNGE